ncbi:hypothetical protein GCM10010394_28550 [Streptomyces crystallinus]|uniref:Uncharacterized protein n=1 Tax=Streptomyces crystallinus TaxID=68191 RepID=A0ABN1FT11_9ACTN
MAEACAKAAARAASTTDLAALTEATEAVPVEAEVAKAVPTPPAVMVAAVVTASAIASLRMWGVRTMEGPYVVRGRPATTARTHGALRHRGDRVVPTEHCYA